MMPLERVEYLMRWARKPDPEEHPEAYPEDIAKALSESPEKMAKAREHIANGTFMADHWIENNAKRVPSADGKNDVILMTCPFFNKSKRTCEAYEKRPPVCSGFPWYDQEPVDRIKAGVRPSDRCSFWEDVPLTMRPKGWKPLSKLELLAGNHKARF